MSAQRLRILMVAAFIAAAILNVVGKKHDSPFEQWLSYALFIVGVFTFISWRRELTQAQRGRVLDREAKTPDETGTGPDK